MDWFAHIGEFFINEVNNLFDYFRSPDGKIKPQHKRAGFRGTLRYVSIRVHDRQEQGPSDDLISLFYTCIELLRSELPWRALHHQNQIRSAKEQLKQDDFQQISEGFGEDLREFGRAVYNMQFDDEPNYAALQDIMKATLVYLKLLLILLCSRLSAETPHWTLSTIGKMNLRRS